PNGVGSWRHRAEDFPRGLKPLSDAAHERGMEFCLWFEPERVFHTSDLGKEHPEFCLGTGEQRLLDLGNPEALAHVIDLLNRKIDEYGVDIYREDFNFDPLAYWQEKDEPEREGMAEIRFTEGLYAMWDGIVEAHPGMPIDNCASGGRRIDLETVSRSYALWRSDFQDVGILGRRNYPWVAAIAGQVQNVGLGMYVPFSAAAVYAFDPYSFRSSMSTGAPLYMDLRDPALDKELAKQAVAECKALREYWLGDLYPLTPVTVDAADWCAFQLDRPEDGDGIAFYFRRHESPYLGLTADLKALDAGATYEYSISTGYGKAKSRRATGDELAQMPIIVEDKPGSALVRYRRIEK
ncbi:MAG TPA: alpha-galactosidase, partial [Dehalococcoidia bacterium]|nr:alpha-galactosidase [Dehalococcoidia bacterium]